MSELNRRDAVKMAAYGATALGISHAFGGQALAQEGSKASMDASVKMIADAMSAAPTPEEAYKIMMAHIGDGITQAVASGMAAIISGVIAKSKENNQSDEWTQFVRGCKIDIDFGAPYNLLSADSYAPGKFKEILTNTLTANKSAEISGIDRKEGAPGVFGGFVEVRGGWSF